jgi:hypothetical protein
MWSAAHADPSRNPLPCINTEPNPFFIPFDRKNAELNMATTPTLQMLLKQIPNPCPLTPS